MPATADAKTEKGIVMEFIIVRHGQTDWNVAAKIQGITDIPLNAEGIAQAERFAVRYDLTRILAVYSSPLQRALKTAQIIADKAGVEAIPMAGLEEMNLGIFEGHSWEEVSRLYKAEYERWEQSDRMDPIESGEGYRQVADRAVAAMRRIYEKHRGQENEKAIMIVTHSATMKALLCRLYQIPYSVVTKRYHIHNLTAISLRVKWEGDAVVCIAE